MTYKEALAFGDLTLKAAEISEHRLDANRLLQFVCHTSSEALFSKPDYVLTKEEEDTYSDLIKKRAKHVPLQHLTNCQGFMGLDFFVNEDVLIPRQDTETLVEEAMIYLHDGMRILDLCTGSGCILLSLLHYTNDCEGVGTDLSPKALTVARENAKRLSLDATFLEGDLFAPVEGTFDMIVSNPPYIRTCEIEELMPEVRDYEPFMALNGKEDGVTFYRRIAAEAPKYLKKGGMLLFEIGCDQGEAVSLMLKEAGFKDVTVKKDLCGLDRVVLGRTDVYVR